MANLTQTRAIDFISLSSKALINDLKEAATCDVRTVCRLACHRCPYVVNNMDMTKINLNGLSSYSIELIKKEDQQLMLNITTENLDNWIAINHLHIHQSS